MHQAAADKNPIFAKVRLLDRDKPEDPRETAKEITQLRAKMRRKKPDARLQADLSFAVTAILKSS
ncbi:hypothetical protein D3C86_1701940 [compost metagenome]